MVSLITGQIVGIPERVVIVFPGATTISITTFCSTFRITIKKLALI
jgi:hypothetical protein